MSICIHNGQSNSAAYVKKAAKATADTKPLKMKNAPNQADNFVIFQWSSLLKITFLVAQPCQIYKLLVFWTKTGPKLSFNTNPLQLLSWLGSLGCWCYSSAVSWLLYATHFSKFSKPKYNTRTDSFKFLEQCMWDFVNFFHFLPT